MIKVIKPARAEYRCTCPFCKAILEFRSEDIECETGEYINFELIHCPECQVPIYREDSWGAPNWETIKYD